MEAVSVFEKTPKKRQVLFQKGEQIRGEKRSLLLFKKCVNISFTHVLILQPFPVVFPGCRRPPESQNQRNVKCRDCQVQRLRGQTKQNCAPGLVSRLPRPVGLQVRVPVVLLVLLVLLQPQRAHVCGGCRLPLLPLLADGGGGQRGHDGGGGGRRTVAKSSAVFL